MTISKQLDLFKTVDPAQYDELVKQLESMISTYKHQALHIEISIGKEKPFARTLEVLTVLYLLATLVCPDSPKYRHKKSDYWNKITRYEPYYASLEPRSPWALSQLALDNNRRSKAILLRFKTILDGYKGEANEILTRLYLNFDKIPLDFKKIYGYKPEL